MDKAQPVRWTSVKDVVKFAHGLGAGGCGLWVGAGEEFMYGQRG